MEKGIAFYRENRELLLLLEHVVHNCRIQNEQDANQIFSQLMNRVEPWLQQCAEFGQRIEADAKMQAMPPFPDAACVLTTLQQLLQARESGDYVLLADYLEYSMKPLLERVFENLRSLFPDIGVRSAIRYDWKKWKLPKSLVAQLERVEPYPLQDTSSGFPTMALFDEQGEYYLHSNGNPVLEAEGLALQYVRSERDTYRIYGCGLGYHVNAVLARAEHIRAAVYERDLRVLRTALEYCNWGDWLQNGRLMLYYDPNLVQFAAALDDAQAGVMIHAPSLRNGASDDGRTALKTYYAQESGVRKQSFLMCSNFYQNVKNTAGYATEITQQMRGNTVVIVSAGPSFDRNAQVLRNLPEHTQILAVSTVYRKLLGMGIRPNFVIHSDAQPKTFHHIHGIAEEIPLFVLSTAYEGCARYYPGKSYLVCQRDFDLGEEYAKKRGLPLYETGGSVATAALSVAVESGAARVILVGQDLAYTNGRAHAAGVSRQDAGDLSNAVLVPGYYGGTVESSVVFAGMIHWFSDYVKAHAASGCDFINATQGGARISGFRQVPLDEALAAERS